MLDNEEHWSIVVRTPDEKKIAGRYVLPNGDRRKGYIEYGLDVAWDSIKRELRRAGYFDE